MGSVSQNVLAHATCSVRVARTRDSPHRMPPRLLVAVDGSRDAELAVKEVVRRNWPTGTEVRVVTAVDPQLAIAVAYDVACGAEPQAERDVVSTARRCTEAAARWLSDRGLVATPVVEEADPKRLLLEQATRWPADCVFVGAKGHRRLERLLLGSVSAALAARAPCTVEVVRNRSDPIQDVNRAA